MCKRGALPCLQMEKGKGKGCLRIGLSCPDYVQIQVNTISRHNNNSRSLNSTLPAEFFSATPFTTQSMFFLHKSSMSNIQNSAYRTPNVAHSKIMTVSRGSALSARVTIIRTCIFAGGSGVTFVIFVVISVPTPPLL